MSLGIYWNNPVKICVLIACALTRLNKLYKNLPLSETIEKYCKLAIRFIDESESLRDVERMIKDTCYNRLQVLDMICFNKIPFLLDNHKVCIVVDNLWSGPFERESFAARSTAYQISCRLTDFSQRPLYGFIHDKAETVIKILKNPKKRCNKLFKQDKERKAHFFQFETWRASIDSMYIIDGLFIIIMGKYTLKLLLSQDLSIVLCFYSNMLANYYLKHSRH